MLGRGTMGLFDKRDKKKRDDFDSPVEQIDLSAAPTPAPKPAPTPPPAAAAPAPAPTPVVAKQPEPAPAPKPAPAPAPAARPTSPEADDYGIEKAIELMRTLPSDNIELVVQVVKFSLESVGIKLPAIIEDAIRRQKDIQGRIGVLKGEIADLEGEIKQRTEEIGRLETDHKETTMVRDRLELAENLGKPGASVPSMAAPAPAPSPSAGIPRVTKQTTPPPLGTPPSPMSSSQSGPIPTAPTKK